MARTMERERRGPTAPAAGPVERAVHDACETEPVATAPDESAEPGGKGFCGIAAAAALLGDAWTLLLLRDLAGGPRRFTELQVSTRISPRVLTDRLRSLCDRGIMTRRMYAEIPPRVEYTLTDKGRAALPVLDALRVYGEQWLQP